MLDDLLTIGLGPTAASARPSASPLGDLLTGPENRLVVWAVRQLLEAEPLVELVTLVGPSGTGKTLAAAEIARLWRTERPDDRVVLITAADFARALSHARKTESIEDFRAKHRQCQLLAIDGLDEIGQRATAQDELARTLDALSESGGRVLITMRTSPAELRSLAAPLASRLMGGLTAPVELPNEPTRRAVMQHLAERLSITIDEQAADLLAQRLSVTVPELHGWLVRLASETNNRITLTAARDALSSAGANQPSGPALAEIANIVAKRCRVKKAEMQGPARRASLVRARGLAMLAARRLSKKSLSEIGRYFGGRDHTTVMHACRKTEELLSTDPQWAAMWNELAADLREA